MTSASKPHHVVDADGVTLGYTHFGMLAAARWIRAQVILVFLMEFCCGFEAALLNAPNGHSSRNRTERGAFMLWTPFASCSATRT